MSAALPSCLRAALYDWECERVAGRRDQDVGIYSALARGLGGRVLELACGTGRVSVPVADRVPGAWVVGLDSDPVMLAGAASRAAGSPARGRVALVRADMRRFALARPFDLVAIPYNSLQLLTDDSAAADCMAAAAAHLRPGGMLALEVTDYTDYTDCTECGVGPGPLPVTGEPLGEGSVAGMSVELDGGLDHDPWTGLTRYHRRWTLRRPGGQPMVSEDTVVLRAFDEPTLDAFALAAGLEPGERRRHGRSLRYSARRP